MRAAPPVSFLIPVRDGAAFLAEALASVQAQTLPDFEVVVVDDGSVDETPEVIEHFVRHDPRFRRLTLPATGLVGALRAGLEVAGGRWIARMDADDVLEPDRLAAQLPLLEADPTLALVDGQVRLFRDEGEVPEGMLRYVQWVNGLTRPEDFDREILIESPIIHPLATIRKVALDEAHGWRDGPFPEDYDLWCRLHAAGWRFAKVPRVLLAMRDRPRRLTRTDPRYGPSGFRSVRERWLMAKFSGRPHRVALWGAGKTGRPWARWLLAQGHTVPLIIDVDPSKIGKRYAERVPIRGPEALADLQADLLLVAVGARGARDLIREEICRVRPDWTEGVDWRAVS